jgi:GNAT superfamily N-acetyltransferase
MILITVAQENDRDYLASRFRHIRSSMFEIKFKAGEYLLIKQDNRPFGWLRWGYFWDEIPFMNMLQIEEPYRNQGYGRQLVEAWEQHMRDSGYDTVLTSTQSDETAQHFYRKLGYVDRGALFLPDEALEIILMKSLTLS